MQLYTTAARKDDDTPTPPRATLPRKVAPPAPENQPTAAPLGYNILVSKHAVSC